MPITASRVTVRFVENSSTRGSGILDGRAADVREEVGGAGWAQVVREVAVVHALEDLRRPRGVADHRRDDP